MKRITNILLLLLLMSTVILVSCAKQAEEWPIPATADSVQSFYTIPYDTVALDGIPADSTNDAVDFNWSFVNDAGKTVHSYTLQIDALSGNFSNPYSLPVGNLVQSYDNVDFEAIALNLGLASGERGQLKARIEYLPASGSPQYSPVFTFYVIPY
jgi:hypothetical protein